MVSGTVLSHNKPIAPAKTTTLVSDNGTAKKASITKPLLDKVPRKVASRLHVCPILFDEKTATLSVVAADMFDLDVAKQIQMVSRARDVKVYVARPATIEALIRKHYDGDIFAFEEDVSSGRLLELQEQLQSGRLAAAGLPHQAERLGTLDIERDVVDGLEIDLLTKA